MNLKVLIFFAALVAFAAASHIHAPLVDHGYLGGVGAIAYNGIYDGGHYGHGHGFGYGYPAAYSGYYGHGYPSAYSGYYGHGHGYGYPAAYSGFPIYKKKWIHAPHVDIHIKFP